LNSLDKAFFLQELERFTDGISTDLVVPFSGITMTNLVL